MVAEDTAVEAKSPASIIPAEHLAGLEYRNVGPHRGGRVVAVAGHPRDPMAFFFGACAGGLWKTEDAGTFWECVTDGFLKTAAVGAVAISDSDPNVIYAGMGETTIRGDVSHGDGVYKSTDGGKTWNNVGLADTRHIAKVRVHAQNPDLVYVAALGHAWGPNEERGLYRSADGGTTWQRILFRSNRAGAIDLTVDPNNPRVMYCAFWEAKRTPYSMESGGPGSSLYKSTDGGDTWTDITRSKGLPRGVLGKIGVAACPARPDRVWALIEADDGALFRSDDGGDSWQRISEEADLRRRAWYYMHIYADPQDPDVVWVLNLQAWKSIDGGSNFKAIPTPHGDNHDLWIDPANPQRMIEGNDGGACVSFNGGSSWSTILNQPTAQFYHVAADNQVPYRLYGSQQDNTAISVASTSVYGAITEIDWFVPGGGESGYIAIRPDDPNIQYAGDHRGHLTRHDRRTGQQRIIDVWPDFSGMYEGAESQRYRFQWTFPIFLSPFDPDVLYVAGNHLFRSTDEGASWEVVSPDLTRNEPTTLKPSGGPITRDNTSAEYYATIFAALESPRERGTLWVGTDDGLVHISRDGGKTWQEITPQELKSPEGEWALISTIEVSQHDAATAFIAATRYKFDDTRPYLYKTEDYGTTWTKIISGIPDDDFTRVVREDPVMPGLLYAGTETGLYVSFDGGESWETLQTNLPVCPIHDLIVHDDDLIVGTHGRSFWILDDITPLHQIARDREARTRLFKPRATIRFKIYEGFGGGEGELVLYRMAGPVTYAYRQEEKPNGTKESKLLNAGKNRPNGVVITYYLAAKPDEEISLTILDVKGGEVRTFKSKTEKPEAASSTQPGETDPEVAGAEMASEEETEGSRAGAEPEADEESQEPFIPGEQGINRFVWNFRFQNATRIPGDKFSEFATAGPVVPPGTYQLRLAAGGQTFDESFEVLKDPRVDATQTELQDQYELGMKIRESMSWLNEAVIQIRDLRGQIKAWEKNLDNIDGADDARALGKGLIASLTAVEEELVNTKATGRLPYPPPNVPTRLNQRLAWLSGVIGSSDAAPTKQSYEVFEEVSRAVKAQLDALSGIVDNEVPRFNHAVRRLDVPAVVVKGAKEAVAAG
jgi:photosystem II stability/assembly factor-like uncharacterized protein